MEQAERYFSSRQIKTLLENRYAWATAWEHRILKRMHHDICELPEAKVEPVVHCIDCDARKGCVVADILQDDNGFCSAGVEKGVTYGQ